MKVLHVEDDPDIRTIAQIALESVGGFVLLQCEDGHKAIQEAKGFAPDLLLLDAMMPGLSGPETLSKLRTMAALKNVPAIFMTAKARPDEITAFLNLGAVGVITKPFDPMTLASQIAEKVANPDS